MKKVKDFLRKVKLFYKKRIYKRAQKKIKTSERTIFFESYQGRSYSCSPKAIFEEMRDSGEYSGYEFVWAFRNIDSKSDRMMQLMGSIHSSKGVKVRVVKYESSEYYKALAQAKYWIMNSNTRPFVEPKKNQVYVQTWHGTPFKKIGLDVPGSDLDYSVEGKKFSYMISPSKYCTEKLVSAFGLEGREDIVLETGYPRNDELFDYGDGKVERIKKELGIDLEKKVILYAPTFRDNEHSEIEGYENVSGIDFESFKEKFGEDYVVLFRAHYFIAKQMDLSGFDKFVYDVSDYENVNDLYIASDILVTDYSSVFFDYANLRKPIVLYMYDFENYKQNAREFYLDEFDLPGKVVKNQNELEEEIKKLTSGIFVPDAKYTFFNNRFNYLDGKDRGLKVMKEIIHQ